MLKAFFARERAFFLTGGAALAGYHLHHRATDDLDLFALEASAFEPSELREFVKNLVARLLREAVPHYEAPGE